MVTLDLCMPEEDGMATLSELKNARFKGHVIIISGQDSSMREVACRLAEVRGLKSAGHMSKPIDLTALRQLLTNLRPERFYPGREGPADAPAELVPI